MSKFHSEIKRHQLLLLRRSFTNYVYKMRQVGGTGNFNRMQIFPVKEVELFHKCQQGQVSSWSTILPTQFVNHPFAKAAVKLWPSQKLSTSTYMMMTLMPHLKHVRISCLATELIKSCRNSWFSFFSLMKCDVSEEEILIHCEG